MAARSASRVSQRAAAARVAAPVRAVACRAAGLNQVQKVASTAAVALGTALASGPAQAVVESRMNGDGTHLILGVNDPILGVALLTVFGTVWALFSTSAAGFGGPGRGGRPRPRPRRALQLPPGEHRREPQEV